MNKKLGDFYKIKCTAYYTSSDGGIREERIAKLIFEGPYFYTFEYQSLSGDLLRVTLDKQDRDHTIEEV